MPRLRFLAPAAFGCLAAVAGIAAATEITLSLPGDAPVEREIMAYDCGKGGMLSVEYINANGVSLALFTYGGEPVVASNVIAASGARYAGGRYVWWSKGRDGALYDLTLGEDAPPTAECTEAP